MTLLFKTLLLTFLVSLFSPSPVTYAPNNDLSQCTVVNNLLNSSINKNYDQGIKKIVIDAGHGGKDLGCRGDHSIEKNIVLSIAKKLGSMVRYTHPEIEVIYTRETDVFIPLYRRIEMANQNDADLFISLHCNHFGGTSTHGSETYVMGLHTTEENLDVAKRENSSVLYEADFKTTYGGYDPTAPETHIILSAIQNAYLEKSIDFADRIESSIAKRTLMRSRGVKQAGFVVLRRATMPSVLIETGFLSNRKDESYLSSDEGQEAIARSIMIALSEYKRDLDADLAKITKPNPSPSKHSSAHTGSQNQAVSPKKQPEQSYVNQSPPKTVKPTNTESNKLTYVVNNKPQAKKEMIYRVQIAASINKAITKKSKQWNQIPDLEIREEANMYKYLTGSFKSLNDALSYRQEMLQLGFKGAFVVAYVGETRVNI